MKFIINFHKKVKERLLIKNRRKRLKRSGKGLINIILDCLPVELYLLGYRYCGPGIKIAKRLQVGAERVNPLYQYFKQHNAALKRVTLNNTSLGEKLAALGVAGIMKVN